MPTSASTIADKLLSLRQQFTAHGINGYLIPRADEYQSEYVAPYANRLQWISGFSGSAGAAIVLENKAAVLTDGRYQIQIMQEVDGAHFDRVDSTRITQGQWLAAEAQKNSVIGYDPKLFTPSQLNALRKHYKDGNFKPLPDNLVDAIWDDQPAAPLNAVELFPDIYAGVSMTDKKAQILAEINKEDAAGCVITMPDSICWLLNMRGSDIDFNPVVLSTVILDAQTGGLEWFVEDAKIPQPVRAALQKEVTISDPATLEKRLKDLAQQSAKIGKPVWLDTLRSSEWFETTLMQSGAQIKPLKDPCINPKAQKNTAEQAAIRAAHITDGVAMVKFLHWLDQQNETSGQDELSVAAKLESFRQQGALYRGQSFSTISGFAGNGAIVHYHPTAASNAKIDRAGLLLVDSGAQYANGTTDITRTVAIGSPTSEMRESFTRVLKGHIAVAAARFPKGTVGKQIDSLARAPLRVKNMDYAHGTGHGVGCYLSVHEEAAGISSRVNDALEPGMLLSNEPGYYKKDEYGIRIENLILVQEGGICADTGSLMYCFETVSFAPIDRKLIEPDLLDRDEKSWLNAYHQKVYDTLKDKLPKDEQDWLKDQIQPI